MSVPAPCPRRLDWPALSPQELAVLSALSRSDALKQQILARSPARQAGEYLPLGKDLHQILAPAGAGMTSWVYRVRSRADGAIRALKQLRFPIAYLKQLLALEAGVAELLAQESELAVAEVLAASETALLKRWVAGVTLQALLAEGQVLVKQKAALVAALRVAARFFHEQGLLLDLSPKNLAWEGQRWCLLDAGPKIHRSDYEHLLREPTWEHWLDFFSARIQSAESRPSVLSRSVSVLKHGAGPEVFVNHLYIWLPLDPEPQPGYFFARIQAAASQSDMLLQSEPLRWHEGLVPTWLKGNPWLEWLARSAKDAVVPSESPPALWRPSQSPLSGAELMRFLRSPVGFFSPPRLSVKPYRHWSDLEDPHLGHRPTDIYCQDPLPMDRHLLPSHLSSLTLSLSPDPETLFLDVCLIPSQKQGSEQILLILPGFRAAPEAAWPLIARLEEQAPASLYLVARMGMRNAQGQALLGGGVAETCLLWYLLDYLQQAWKSQGLILMAASYATIPAILLAGLHPLIQGLILDSPVCRPMDLLFWLGESYAESPAHLRTQLTQAGLPACPFELRLNLPEGFPCQVFHPQTDRFTQICGRLEGPGPTCFYPGSHAASLRHDTVRKGIPTPLWQGLVNFLKH